MIYIGDIYRANPQNPDHLSVGEVVCNNRSGWVSGTCS